MKKALKIVLIILLVLIGAVVIFLGWVTIREYRPAEVEQLMLPAYDEDLGDLAAGGSLRIMSFNTGYAALSKTEDFFMDGGSKVMPDNAQLVDTNMAGIAQIMAEADADLYFLQEVDTGSRRSYYFDQAAFYENELLMDGVYTYNYKADFVPYPIPPIGKVQSGLLTLTAYNFSEASRIALPCPFSWPVRTVNLKRCILETRIPVAGTDKELVLMNFHLEAYDSGEGKIAQTKMLSSLMEEEYAKGNYVIAGGDFNQTFEGMDTYPILNKDDWVPGIISSEDLPEGFSFAVSDNVPTCRLLNGPYSGNYQDSQVYVIDGFIVSDNVAVDLVENMDVGFEYTDHQPVVLDVTLK